MINRTLIVLLLTPIALLAACAGPGDGTTENVVTPAKPLIDTSLPAVVETATFAFG